MQMFTHPLRIIKTPTSLLAKGEVQVWIALWIGKEEKDTEREEEMLH